ncbi:MAG: serine/threonine-protein kinase, partial [bacterium]
MDTKRWERIQDLFHRALDMPAGTAAEFVRAEAPEDVALAEEVIGMLAEDRAGGGFLDRALPDVAREVLESDVADAVPQRRFGPYRPLRRLGEGGMGVVFLAERDDLGNRVALKILRDGWVASARRERFEFEARALARFDHPAIARLLDAGTTEDGTPWIAMEYVDGRPLTEHCRERQASWEERLDLFRETCEAVRHAHRHAIIHRDLKPSNVFVRGDGRIKLLDFGIAKSLDAIATVDDRTHTRWAVATPAYAAPEQLRGDAIGVYTDVYSLGVILYELLTGRRPFEVEPRAAAAGIHPAVAGSPVPPSQADPTFARRVPRSVRADLDVLCLHALQPEEDRRYSTVDALLEDLERLRGGRPLVARRDSLAYRTARFARRNRRALVAGAAIAGLLAVVGAVSVTRTTAARREAEREAARAARIQDFMLSLFDGGAEDAAPPESLRVVTLLERGAAAASALQEEPIAQADLYQTLGDVQAQLGNYEPADSLLSAALRVRRAHREPHHADVLRSLVSLASLRIQQARLDQAEQYLQEAGMIASDRAIRAADRGSVALERGRLLEARGEYGESVREIERAVASAEEADDDVAATAALHELANVRFYLGDYAASDSLNRIVLERTRRRLGAGHPSVADNLVNLGAVRSQLGEYEEAERFFREGLEITRAWYGDDHPKTASNRTMLGRALVAEGKVDEARSELEQALAVARRVSGEEHPSVASILNELGMLALAADDLDGAEKCFRDMAEIYRRAYGDAHDFVAVAESNVASVLMRRGDWAAAERRLADVVDHFRRSVGDEHLNTAIARVKHGRTLLRLGRFDDAALESAAGRDALLRLEEG